MPYMDSGPQIMYILNEMTLTHGNKCKT